MERSSIMLARFMSIPDRLLSLRRSRGLTQQEMADKVNLHVNQIRRYEAGSSEPSLEALKKIAKGLHVSLDYLVFEDEERGPTNETLKLKFEAVSRLEPDEQKTIVEIIDGMLLKHDAKRYFSRSMDREP